MKYSDTFVGWLSELGYTHCFYVAGGNIMHLLESASQVFTCVPVVHEVTAGIAAEYFNESQIKQGKKAFAMVTAGPGLTNIITAMAGAYLESRDLLVIGGQVKSADLSDGSLRQSGIQEINGMALVDSLTVAKLQIREPEPFEKIAQTINTGLSGKRGPVFIDFCLDAQGAMTPSSFDVYKNLQNIAPESKNELHPEVLMAISKSERPVLLLGGGVSRSTALELQEELGELPIPVMTTWNGTDRIDSDANSYFGRPNTWGQRSANIILQQADLLIAVGTRLGLQQTGFNWEEFLPVGKIIQIEIDQDELSKRNPSVQYPIRADANQALPEIIKTIQSGAGNLSWRPWFSFATEVKATLPLSERVNRMTGHFVNPYDFYLELSTKLLPGDAVIPSSSGAAETVAMQSLKQGKNTTVITTKGLASMGYGLGGAIGASIGGAQRVLHIEGDGGFAQNLQELGTIAAQNLNVKTFILCNDGYASIRMTQKSYFDGHYVGCDTSTGLGLPDWAKLAAAYDIPVLQMRSETPFSVEVIAAMESVGPCIFLVPINPEQTYFPKITSVIDESGNLKSNPIHLMTPPLDHHEESIVFRYLQAAIEN